MKNKLIKQISIFAENKPGRLEEITGQLKSADINIRAFTIAEAGDFGVLRMVVDKPDKAHKVLHDAGFTVSETDVLGVEMSDSPGGLHKIATVLGANNINVDYAYAFATATENAQLIIRVDVINNAIKALDRAGVVLIGIEDLK
ncbi:MAG: ACT domain-containing protein [Methanosarcinales archaeon]|nr:ACT domain-containing protein [Methanosarcinales archaeon]